MPYKVSTMRFGSPLSWNINLPDVKAEEILFSENTDAAVSFARALLAPYDATDKQSVFVRTLDGHKFIVDLSEDADASIKGIFEDFMLHGTYEQHTMKLVKEIVKPGMTVMDVGASIGFFTVNLADLVGPTGKVIAIEATANQFPYLQRNIELNGFQERVTALNVAAADVDGPITIQCNAVNPKQLDGKSLDQFVDGPIDFLKLDVDGSDLRALKGLEKTIQNSPNMKAVLEFYPAYLENLGSDPKEFEAFVDKYFTHTVIDGDYGTGCWNWYCERKV